MITSIRLIEPTYPGMFVGKEVITKDSKKIGICNGLIMDLNSKEIFILVTNSEYLLKIPLENVISVEKDFVVVDYTLPLNLSMSSEDLQKIKQLVQTEVQLLSRLLQVVLNGSQTDFPRGKDYIAKLFHLI